MQLLRQGTAATVPMGPFLDEDDGKTAETGLTIAQADVRLSKMGTAYAQKNDATAASHMEGGDYGVVLDATDTDTVGRMRIRISKSGALPVWDDFLVVPANVYDAMTGADKLQVHVDEITAGLITAAAFAADAITSTVIADDAITAAKIQDAAITAAKFAAAAITSTVLAADAITSAKFATAAITATVLSSNCINSAKLASGTITAAKIQAAAITAAKFAANAIAASNVAADALANIKPEVGIDMREAQSLILAACAGKLAGAGTTTITIKGAGNDVTRIVATVDELNNRVNVVLTPS